MTRPTARVGEAVARFGRPVAALGFGLACVAAAALAAEPGSGPAGDASTAAPTVDTASATTTADAAPPARSPADEVGRMLEAMAQSEAEVRSTLQRLDDFITRGPAQFAAASAAADWRWTLLEQVSTRLRALLDPDALAAQRESARQRLERGDVAGARSQIVEYMQPFMARGEEAGTLMNYIPRRLAANLATTRLRALLRANGVPSPELPRVEQLEALIASREARDDFMMAADLELSELEALAGRAYDGAFAAALSAARAKAPAGLALQDRTARCPVVSDLGPVTDAPKINSTLSTPTSAYYPREALADGIEGKVAVYARVTPEGCVRAAGVLVSTGVEALDAAALRWMLEGAVFSRSKPRGGGEPATAMLNVNFKAGD